MHLPEHNQVITENIFNLKNQYVTSYLTHLSLIADEIGQQGLIY